MFNTLDLMNQEIRMFMDLFQDFLDHVLKFSLDLKLKKWHSWHKSWLLVQKVKHENVFEMSAVSSIVSWDWNCGQYTT